MSKGFSNYYEGVFGLDASSPKMPGDNQAISDALSIMDDALAQARSIRDQNSGVGASIKSAFTGVDTGTIASEVATFEKAASSMHDTGSRLIADDNTTHDRIIEFIRSVKSVANISALKDSGMMNRFDTLISDVSSKTLQDLGNKAQAATSMVWDNIPLPYKIGGGAALGIILWWKFLR